MILKVFFPVDVEHAAEVTVTFTDSNSVKRTTRNFMKQPHFNMNMSPLCEQVNKQRPSIRRVKPDVCHWVGF